MTFAGDSNQLFRMLELQLLSSLELGARCALAAFRLNGDGGPVAAARHGDGVAQTTPSPAAEPETACGMLPPLQYRAQGREEALAIILAQDPEDPFSGCTRSLAIADAGDYSTAWDDDKLRTLLNIGDARHDAFGRAEVLCLDAQARILEAESMLRMVERAPWFKPLHDFLVDQQAWHLLSELGMAARTESSHEEQDRPADSAMEHRSARPAVSKDYRIKLYLAAINTSHVIEEDRIVLMRNPKVEGNALSQLADRLAAVEPPEPAIAARPHATAAP